MNVLILSDLHFEFHRDGGRSLVESLPVRGVDVCVLAGDITVGKEIPAGIALFCERYPQVVYVHGNHEYYHCPIEDVIAASRAAVGRHVNLHWLDCSSVEIAGVCFHGAPLWFPEAPGAPTQYMSDFHVIEGFVPWVYQQNERAVSYLGNHVQRGDVVVTHHLPSHRSVAEEYRGHALNPFFVCDVEPIVARTQPKLWIHGHTHSSVDYMLGETRVVCNPFGYAAEEENEAFRAGFLVAV